MPTAPGIKRDAGVSPDDDAVGARDEDRAIQQMIGRCLPPDRIDRRAADEFDGVVGGEFGTDRRQFVEDSTGGFIVDGPKPAERDQSDDDRRRRRKRQEPGDDEHESFQGQSRRCLGDRQDVRLARG